MIGRIQKLQQAPRRARGACKGRAGVRGTERGLHAAHEPALFPGQRSDGGATTGRTAFYVCGCIVCFALILLTTWFQYNDTYFITYKESGKRRLTLAERLRKLPLSFFGKRDLADLTSTIMADCEVLEKSLLPLIPGCSVRLISTVLISLSLFAFDWRMALAALWVIPVSVAIVLAATGCRTRYRPRPWRRKWPVRTAFRSTSRPSAT